MKKFLSMMLVVVMVFALVACTGTTTPSTTTGGADTTTAAPVEQTPTTSTGGMTLNVGAYPDTIDPALNSAVDGATYIIHNFVGLVGYDKTGALAPMCAAEIPTAVVAEDGKTTYTFTLRDDLKWSDGSALTAEDFVYSWKRAADPATAADYGYMFDVIDGYAEGNLNVTAVDAKTLQVVLTTNVPYFMELCAFPTYMPVKKDVVEANGEAWATKAETYIGNGAYKVTSFTQAELVLEKNENYWDADSIVSDKITFAFNDDDSSLLANYKNGSYLFIDSVPQDEIATLEKEYPNEYFVEGQLGTYYVSFNVNDKALEGFTEEEKADIRHALGLMIERNYVCTDIGQAGQVPAAGFVAMGLTDADGKTQYIDKNGVNRDGKGYYSVNVDDYAANCEEAVKLLEGVAASSGKFTVKDGVVEGFPTLTYITNEGTGHEAVAAYLQATWGQYGFTINVETQEWATFLNTRKNGDYSVARNGWLGDYNDPISFLDMWITESGNNDSQFGKDAHATYAGYDGKTWAESYDAIIARVKASSDPEVRFELMHQAEDILMQTGAICPIYYYTDIYMCSQKIDGFFSSPLGYKFFMYASVK